MSVIRSLNSLRSDLQAGGACHRLTRQCRPRLERLEDRHLFAAIATDIILLPEHPFSMSALPPKLINDDRSAVVRQAPNQEISDRRGTIRHYDSTFKAHSDELVMRALNPGSFIVKADPSDDYYAEVLLFGLDEVVPEDRIRFGTATLAIEASSTQVAYPAPDSQTDEMSDEWFSRIDGERPPDLSKPRPSVVFNLPQAAAEWRKKISTDSEVEREEPAIWSSGLVDEAIQAYDNRFG